VHIERYFRGVPADLFYFDRNFDLGDIPVPAAITKTRTRQLLSRLWRHQGVTLEIPEPLWMRELPRTLLLAATWKLSGRLQGRRRRVVSYCMENNEMERLIGGTRRAPRPLVLAVRSGLRISLRILLDALAFASADANRS
jgi:hypothetical protein